MQSPTRSGDMIWYPVGNPGPLPAGVLVLGASPHPYLSLFSHLRLSLSLSLSHGVYDLIGTPTVPLLIDGMRRMGIDDMVTLVFMVLDLDGVSHVACSH